MLLRHAAALILLPGTVTVLVPLWLARRYRVSASAPTDPGDWTLVGVGALLLAAGLALFVSTVLHFGRRGRGTLAPWDPPRHLVVAGPYRRVRNPMISGVILILISEALLLRSTPHALWAATFLILNAIYIPLIEEPQLRVRFGEEYANYTRYVPRIVPRLRPWSSDDGSGRSSG
jgi:protein-S-isoprenylcysteine O-methyltransferase Ste14